MKPTRQLSVPRQKRYFGMTARQSGTLAIMGLVLCCVLGVFYFLVLGDLNSQTLVPAQKPTTTFLENKPEIIVDVPSLFGRSLSEIRSLYKISPYEDLHPLLGYEDILPNGSLSEGYSDGKYSFYVFYDENQESVGFQIYDGLESHRLRVSDWNKIAQMLNLNVTRSPDFISNYRAEWNSVSGYHIEIIRNISGEYVFAVIVVGSR